MDETIVTALDAGLSATDPEPIDAIQEGQDTGVDATDEGVTNDELPEAPTGLDANQFRQQICEYFPGVWIGDLPGETFDEVLAALPEALGKSQSTRSEWQPDPVPSGPISRSAVIDLDSLSPESKIRVGLRR